MFFLLNPVPFYRQGYQKQKGLVTSDQLLFSLQNKFRKIDLLICYILSDQVWWCNVKRCWSYSKNYISKFMQANSWQHKLFLFICPFESGKCGKEEKKPPKIWISRERKELFRWNKKHFIVFEGLSFGENIKNW